MRIFCTKLMATLTGHDRYMPDIMWSANSYVHNIFRVWEYIFGKPYKVCRESATDFWEDSHGNIHIQRRFYTVEAFLAHIEGTIRLAIKSLFTTVEYKRYAFATVCLFILGFELKINTTALSSVFFINAIARDANSTATLIASPATASHTVTGSDTAMYIGTKGSAYTTSATFVNPATRIANNSTVNTYFISLYSLKNPPVGTATLSVAFASGTAGFTAESYTGCDQYQPDVFNTGSITSTTLTTSVTTINDNSWLIGYFSSAANTLSSSTGVTFLIGQVNNVALGDSAGALTPQGSYSMSVTAASGDIVSIIAVIKPIKRNLVSKIIRPRAFAPGLGR